MARVLITGVTGFIGSRLAERLVKLGHTVYGTARHCASRELRPLENILDEIVLLTADISDYMSVVQTLKSADPDCIFHLGALTPVRLSFEKPFEYERVNYIGTMNVVQGLMELPDYKKKRIIVASTAEVYGTHKGEEKALNEETLLKPSSPYAVSKAAADMYVRMAADVYGVDGIVLRPVNTYGRRFETNFIVEYIVTSMLKEKKVYIGAPESIREYMYVDDHVNAYIQAWKKGQAGEVYNIATGKGIKNKDLVEKIALMVHQRKKNVVYGSYPPGYPLRPSVSDQPYIILDSSKARRHLGWKPKVELEDGLRRTVEYWKGVV
jgi:nucleoside-diphosphate-sugar epimerase